MTFVLFVVAAAFTIGGLLWDNSTAIAIGWVGWALGLASAYIGWRRRRHTFGSVEAAQGAAEAGNPRAMRELAMNAKINGDLDEAERLLRAAIDKGDIDSMWEMGRLVESRDGLAASEPWYRMAAEHGHMVAKEFFKPGYPLNLNGDNPL
jgi:TPR repeat protein